MSYTPGENPTLEPYQKQSTTPWLWIGLWATFPLMALIFAVAVILL